MGNANKLLARFLCEHAEKLDVRLLDFTGGTLRNAIPREAVAQLAVAADKVEAFKAAAEAFLATIQFELAAVEKNIKLVIEASNSDAKALSKDSQSRFLGLLNATPNGVIRMSDDVKGVVETSLNVGVVSMKEGEAEIICLIRSLIDSGKDYVVSMLTSVGQLAGAKTSPKGGYPGWKPDPESPVMAQVREIYQGLFNKTPNIMVIHAGLECGLFKKPYPDMDMVSIGPTITGPHSPDEQVHIGSVDLYWQLLTALLKAIPERS